MRSRREFIKLLGVSSLALFAPSFLKAEEELSFLKELGIDPSKVKPSEEVKLSVPAKTDSGSKVPVTVKAEVPPEEVKALYLVVDKNPRPLVLKATFSPMNGEVYLYAQIRMAQSSPVRALLKLNDGTVLMAVKKVEVKEGGCG